MNIARIRNGIVVNIEVGDEQWIETATGDDVLVPYTDEQPARVGLGWEPDSGFEQPIVPTEPTMEPTTPAV